MSSVTRHQNEDLDQLSNIEELKIIEELGRGAHSVVHRVKKGDTEYALKVFHSKGNAEESTLRYRREAATLACLKHPGILKIFSLDETPSASYLLMELISGKTLASRITEGVLTEAEVIKVAFSMAGALGEVHRHGLVHRDVKPKNILLSSDGTIKLIDFGLATRSEEGQESSVIAGSFAYSAPEQTRMLKRPVDRRSDLYGLGIVLFECISGKLPFYSEDAAELVRLHATQQPPDLLKLRPEFSTKIIEIVKRLIAKDPDDRFQTSADLELALISVLDAEVAASSRPETFADVQSLVVAARKDVKNPSLAGREQEFVQLQTSYRRANRTGQICIVHGEAGSGKSHLVKELLAQAQHQGSLILSGKCSTDNPMPFAPLKSALDDYVTVLSRMPEQQREEEEVLLKAILRDFAPILGSFSPRLFELVKDTPYTKVQVEQDKYYAAIAEFICRLARADRSLVFFVDDIHWLDTASAQVLRYIIQEFRQKAIFLIATSRCPASENEQLESLVAQSPIENVTSVAIKQLDIRGVSAIAEQQLGGIGIDPKFLQQLAVRSNYNPFAIGQYLQSMLNAGLLKPYWGKWIVDTDRLESLNLPTDVLQLVLHRITGLSGASKRILSLGAIVGNRFRSDILPKIGDASLDEVNEALMEAMRLNLIDRIESAGLGTYAFVHDRVQEALLSTAGEEEAKRAHDSVANALAEMGDDSNETLYAIARHYALGKLEQTAEAALAANFKAGQLALVDYAEAKSYDYLAFAQQLAAAKNLPLPEDFAEVFGDACERNGRYDEAAGLYQKALVGKEAGLHKGELHVKMAKVYFAAQTHSLVWEQCRAALKAIGESYPDSIFLQVVQTIWHWLIALVVGSSKHLFGSVKGEKRKRLQIMAEAYAVGAHAAYFEVNILQLLQLNFRALRPANWIGDSAELVSAYSSYSGGMAAMGLKAKSFKYARYAVQVAEALNDRRLMGRAMLWTTFAKGVTGDSQGSAEVGISSFDTYGRWMEAADLFSQGGELSWNLAFRGYASEGWSIVERMLNLLTRGSEKGSGAQNHPVNSLALLSLTVLGRANEGLETIKANVEALERYPNEKFRGCLFYSNMTFFCMEQGELGERFEEMIRGFRKYTTPVILTVFHFRQFYVYQAYGRLAQLIKAPQEEYAMRRQKLKDALWQLRLVSDRAVWTCHYYTLKAALCRLDKEYDKAQELLARASLSAIEVESIWAMFEISRQRAYLLRDLGKHRAASVEAGKAYSIAQRNNWVHRASRIASEFELSMHSIRSSHSSSSSVDDQAERSSLKSAIMKRHLESLLQVSLAISTTLDPDQQVGIFLDEILRIVAAERAFLFLSKDETGNELLLKRGRSKDKQDLDEQSKYSRMVVERVRQTREPVIITSTQDGEELGSESVIAYNLRSVLGAPLILRDRLVGVIYVDNQLASGIFTRDDVGILVGIANQIAIMFESTRAAQVELERRTLIKDLELTGAVQSLLLPKQREIIDGPVRLSSFYLSAAQSGGDWFWYKRYADGKLLVLMGDVTGHGAAAAMVTAAVAGSYRLLEVLQEKQEGDGNIGAFMEVLNTNLVNICNGEYWMTFGALLIDEAAGEFQYWNAGGPPIFHLTSTAEIKVLSAPGMPLGSFDYGVGHLTGTLAKGERIFLFTDGVFEMMLPNGEMLSMRKTKKLIQATHNMPTAAACEKFAKDLEEARQDTPLADDITFLFLDRV